MAAIEWLLVLVVAGFLMLFGFTVAPGYINNMTVKAALESLEQEPEIGSMSNMKIKSVLGRKFDMNQITAIKSKDVKIERTKSTMKISANYEERRPLMANIEVVLVFNENVVELPVKSD
jgi:hypothetical protein